MTDRQRKRERGRYGYRDQERGKIKHLHVEKTYKGINRQTTKRERQIYINWVGEKKKFDMTDKERERQREREREANNSDTLR